MSASVFRDWLSRVLHWYRGEESLAATPGPTRVRDISDRVEFTDASTRVTCRDVSDRVELTVVA